MHPDNRARLLNLCACQAFDLESARSKVAEERKLNVQSEPIEDEVVGLSHGELRRDEVFSFVLRSSWATA